jgi:Flp pilus assembly protein TadG
MIGEFLRRRGAAAVEFGLTTPVVVVLCMATAEYGWYFHRLTRVANSTTEAARFAITSPLVDVATDADSRVKYLLDSYGMDCVADLTCEITSTYTHDAANVDYLTLHVRVPHFPLTDMLPTPDYLAAEITMPTIMQDTGP